MLDQMIHKRHASKFLSKKIQKRRAKKFKKYHLNLQKISDDDSSSTSTSDEQFYCKTVQDENSLFKDTQDFSTTEEEFIFGKVNISDQRNRNQKKQKLDQLTKRRSNSD